MKIRKYTLIQLLGWYLLLMPCAVLSETDVYSVQIAVQDQSPREYAVAVRMGLKQVISALDENPMALQRPQVKDALDRADRYVEQYQYARVDDKATLAEIPMTKAADAVEEAAVFLLQLRYSAEEVALLMGQNTVASQGPVTQPQTLLLWLVLESGGNTQIIGGENRPEVKARLEALALDQGLDIVFPLLDLQDYQAIGAADIRGGFEDRIRAASARYDTDAIATGVLSEQAGGTWLSSWRRLASGTNPSFANSALNLDSLVTTGVQWLRQTTSPIVSASADPSASESAMHVWIGRVPSTDAYARISQILENIPNATRVAPVYLAPEGMVFAISPRMSSTQLEQYLDRARWLERTAPPQADELGQSVPAGAELYYEYSG
ncbi:MAG TPA: hypothetical protein DD979_13970 [Gammaproteobacteria bacterium]|jgi:hypothetical protein|nr:hypothetical protein [Gammaproteobacteria bacterium]